MTDPSDFRRDPRGAQWSHDLRGGYRENDLAAYDRRNGGSMWSWLAGVAAVIFIIAIVYGFATRNPQTAAFDRNTPAATTRSSPSGASSTGFGGMETTGVGSSSSSPDPYASR
jgi:hypothetical protein